MTVNETMDFSKIKRSDFAALKDLRIQSGPSFRGSGRQPCFADHMAMLRTELTGSPEITLYHAWLVVSIRREMDLPLRRQQFLELWSVEADFLLKSLNLRWLVSACDTLVDVSPDAAERATALAASLLVNTVKLYETERRLTLHETPAVDEGLPAQKMGPLFDGLTCFAIGRGNMVKQLMQRCLRETGQSISGRILRELLRRLHESDTVFQRVSAAHTNERTNWRELLTAL